MTATEILKAVAEDRGATDPVYLALKLRLEQSEAKGKWLSRDDVMTALKNNSSPYCWVDLDAKAAMDELFA